MFWSLAVNGFVFWPKLEFFEKLNEWKEKMRHLQMTVSLWLDWKPVFLGEIGQIFERLNNIFSFFIECLWNFWAKMSLNKSTCCVNYVSFRNFALIRNVRNLNVFRMVGEIKNWMPIKRLKNDRKWQSWINPCSTDLDEK